MRTYPENVAWLQDEITRLNVVIETAGAEGRHVGLQQALVVHHTLTLEELELGGPETGPA
jgi:hypothetical protein